MPPNEHIPRIHGFRRMYDPDTGKRELSLLQDPFFHSNGYAYALGDEDRWRDWEPLGADEFWEKEEEND